MKRYVLIATVLALLLMIPGYCLASFNQLYWHYFKELPITDSGFSAIKLDKEVMQNCQPDFQDLRVTDQDGREISCQVIQPDKEKAYVSFTEADRIEYPGSTSVVLDLGTNPQAHNRIDLSLQSEQDYMREVTLEASQDNKNWGKIGTGRVMRFHDKLYNSLSFTTSTTRYLRINIKQTTGEKRLKLLSADLCFVPASLYEGQEIQVKVLSKRSDSNRTNIVVDLQVPNYFVQKVIINTPDRNYEREVSVASDDQTTKSNQTRDFNMDTIFDYQWKGYSSTRDYVEMNQYARRYLLLSIENGNSAPLKISNVKVVASPPYLLADLKGPARLWYGNTNAHFEDYDLNKFINLIQMSDLKWVTPGSQQVNPEFQVPWTEQHKWLLDALIILVAAAFILIIIKNFNRIREQVKEEK